MAKTACTGQMYSRYSCPPLLMPLISSTSPTSTDTLISTRLRYASGKLKSLRRLVFGTTYSAMPIIARLDQPQNTVFVWTAAAARN